MSDLTRRRLLASLGTAPLIALPALADDRAWAALSRPGAVAIMRHALAPGTGDPASFRLGDCRTQRNLDARGRAQAARIGQEMRSRGIRFDRVLTSEWCRCRETADLLEVGPVEPFPPLNSFFAERRANGPAQTSALRAFLDALGPQTRAMLVTHQVNITALTGRGVASGEILVIRMGGDGRVTVLGAILIRA